MKQGSVEAITIADGQVLGIGEIGVIGVWENAAGGWIRQEDIVLPAALAEEEFTGICNNNAGLWATSSEELGIFNLEDGAYHPVNLEAFTRTAGDVSSLLISGIDCDDGFFYLITENYTSIIVLDETYRVIEIVGVDAGEASDIAVHDRIAYVTVDHNYFDPRPPVFQYRLSQPGAVNDESR